MKTATRLQGPLPLFFHKPSEHVLYVAHGPVPLVFTILEDDDDPAGVVRVEPVVR